MKSGNDIAERVSVFKMFVSFFTAAEVNVSVRIGVRRGVVYDSLAVSDRTVNLELWLVFKPYLFVKEVCRHFDIADIKISFICGIGIAFGCSN